MTPCRACNEDLIRQLPLPLARLYRRAHNAKTAQDRHHTAYFLWEASLKLLGSVAIVEYLSLEKRDPDLDAMLERLARPALGHWWEFVRRLVPFLADSGDERFGLIRQAILNKSRVDWPGAVKLDTQLRGVLDSASEARASVRVPDLFDMLVRYRNREIGHGAPGLRSPEFYDGMGVAILDGVEAVLEHLDCLAGRRLIFIDDVRRDTNGNWLIERFELKAETARRIDLLECSNRDAERLPLPQRVYVASQSSLTLASGDTDDINSPARLGYELLHPLVIFDRDLEEVLFLNAQRGREQTEYLCYTKGVHEHRKNVFSEQQELLGKIFGEAIDRERIQQWATASLTEEKRNDETQFDATATADPSVALPRTLGEFELISELGRGNMGVVYRSWQPSLGRQVALKCSLRLGDAKVVGRFNREIQALGRVEHPNLVKIFTKGFEGEQYYYAMELIEGTTLSAVSEAVLSSSVAVSSLDVATWQQCLELACEQTRLAERPLSGSGIGAQNLGGSRPPTPSSARTDLPLTGRGYARHIVELIRQVALAAHALHDAGVTHRDIKPSNILVTGDGQQAVLMDLGLAQFADDAQGKLTHTRQFVGSLRYASPEQVLAVNRLDRRSDVYSLGASLWELLTLRPLFGADEKMATPELMHRITSDDPGQLGKYHPGIPRDLEAIVARCLEKKPDHRYPTALLLVEDLQRFLDGRPVKARPVGAFERGIKWVRRRPREAALASLSGVAFLLVFVLFMYYLIDRQRQKNLEVSQESFAIASTAVENLIDTSERRFGAMDSMQPARRELLQIAMQYYKTVADKLGNRPQFSRELSQALTKWPILVKTIQPDSRDNIGVFRETIARLEVLRRGDPRNVLYRNALAKNHFELAFFYLQIGEYKKAIEFYGLSLALRPEPVASSTGSDADRRADQTERALAFGYRGDVYLTIGDLPRAKDDYQRSHQIRLDLVKLSPNDDLLQFQLGRSYGNLGRLDRLMGKMPEAISETRRSIEILRQLVDERPIDEPADSPSETLPPTSAECLEDLAYSSRLLGGLLFESGELDEAIPALRATNRHYVKLSSKRPGVLYFHLSSGVVLAWLADALSDRPSVAAESMETSLKAEGIFQELSDDLGDLAELESERAWNLVVQGKLLCAGGKYADAERRLRTGLPPLEKLVKRNAFDHDSLSKLGGLLSELGEVLARSGREGEALETLRWAVKEQGAAVLKAKHLVLYQNRLALAQARLDRAVRGSGKTPALIKPAAH